MRSSSKGRETTTMGNAGSRWKKKKPKRQETIVFKLDTSLSGRLREILAAMGCEFSEGQHLLFRAVANGSSGTLSYYTSGKIVIQGSPEGLKELALAVRGVSGEASPGKKQFEARIGSDESGKGDYFGPLVVAAAYVDSSTADKLILEGVSDSKKMTDRTVRTAAGLIRDCCPVEVVAVSPARYNELYGKFKNLNEFLAWMHARAIENLAARCRSKLLVVDRFARGRVLSSALMERGSAMKLVEIPRGERDIAVAAASVVARFEFLRHLAVLSERAGFSLPKGATSVIEAGRKVVADLGREKLGEFAKLHFKTTRAVLNR